MAGEDAMKAAASTAEYMPDRVPPNERAPYLLDEVIEHGDENGALANATADELRDALTLAAGRIRELVGRWPVGVIKAQVKPLPWLTPAELRTRSDADRIECQAVVSGRWKLLGDSYWDSCVIPVRWRQLAAHSTVRTDGPD